MSGACAVEELGPRASEAGEPLRWSPAPGARIQPKQARLSLTYKDLGFIDLARNKGGAVKSFPARAHGDCCPLHSITVERLVRIVMLPALYATTPLHFIAKYYTFYSTTCISLFYTLTNVSKYTLWAHVIFL